MDFYHDLLKKAGEDGRINPALVPGNEKRRVRTEIIKRPQPDVNHHLLQLPPEYVLELRNLAESLRFQATRNSLGIIGFSSALSGEGVSTLVANLSLIMAMRSKRVRPFEPAAESTQTAIVRLDPQARKQGLLVVDAQFRKPVLHTIFNVDLRHGLHDLLRDDTPTADLLKNTGYPNLKLMAAGGVMTSALEQLNYEKLGIILENLKARFEFVLVDVPPILQSAEGLPICRLCDGMVLVVQANRTRWQVVAEARRRLQRAEVNIMGCVLNRRKFFIPDWLYRRL